MSHDTNSHSSFIDFHSSFIKVKSLSKQALKIGVKLNKYQIKGYLSEDFFGITYIATHQNSNKSLVIREYFPPDLSARKANGFIVAKDEDAKKEDFNWGLEQFVQESQKLQRFKHPSMITIKAWFVANGTAYRVTKYHKGQTLKEWLSLFHPLNKPPPTEKALLAIIVPLLDALKVLHSNNCLHQNINPENIYICSNHKPLLIDLGGSKQAIANKMGNLNLSLSLGYAAKEQYSGRSYLNACVDIYALSATLYYIVTGKRPVAALDRGDARDEGLSDPLIPATQIGKTYYRQEFLKVIDQGLAYLPKNRPQTVAEFKQLLIEQQYKNRKKITPPRWFSVITKMLLGISCLIFVVSFLPMIAYRQRKKTTPLIYYFPIKKNSTKTKLEPVITEQTEEVTSTTDKKTNNALNRVKIKETAVNKTTWTEPYTGMKFNWIPSGSFVIGNNKAIVKENEKELTIDGFWMGIYEVTVGEFRQFVKETDYKTAAGDKCKKKIGWDKPEFRQTERHPVACVSWLDAQAYIKWLNSKSNKKFRLPSEAQWEYACRSGNKKQLYCGDKALAYLAHYAGNSNNKSSPVGLKGANGMGLYDMTGNVWEWTASEYARPYNGKEMQWLSPDTPKNSPKRVMFRGGSWMYEEQYLSSIYRGNPSTVNLSYDDVGFRLTRIE